MPYEENIKEMLKELDEEVQQPVAEETGNASEPNTVLECMQHLSL